MINFIMKFSNSCLTFVSPSPAVFCVRSVEKNEQTILNFSIMIRIIPFQHFIYIFFIVVANNEQQIKKHIRCFAYNWLTDILLILTHILRSEGKKRAEKDKKLTEFVSVSIKILWTCRGIGEKTPNGRMKEWSWKNYRWQFLLLLC